ncbi:Agenet domain-containing protein [Forsythia ovata]|uniref:Agenet domain-containing protein n=1 Tax=Forsythia ovata TaxID=205694 RepID=A0ABD1PJ81_9LAMI
MGKKMSLPFTVGEEAEARTFEKGYRGAWFRCKIREIRRRKRDVEYLLEYFDFPEEKLGPMKPYQVPVPYGGMPKNKQRMLMVRPPYPPIYRESQMPHASDISEVAVIVNDAWKVGDLVDWLTDDCYWSGRIKQLLGDDKAMINFPKPPLGEGTSDEEALLKDLRPSLDWSPEYGWIVPTPGGETGCPCARLIKPGDQGQETGANNMEAGSSPNMSPSSLTSVKSSVASDELKGNETRELHELSLRITVSKEVMDTQETSIVLDGGDCSTRKMCLSDTDSSSHIRETLTEPTSAVAEGDLHYSSCPLKKYRASRGMTSNSMRPHTLEAAILDLEELVNKVKWLKSVLEHGNPLSDAARPQWKVVEHIASSSMPK